MLVIKIELWPAGDSSRAQTLSVGRIWNTDRTLPDLSDYEFVFEGDQDDTAGGVGCWGAGKVRRFPRLIFPAWELLRRALNAARQARLKTLRNEV